MTARKKSVTRDLLRLVEIALFFAISVIGYGMLAKTSTPGSKSKSRTQLSETRNSIVPERLERALREIRRADGPQAKPLNTSLHNRQFDIASPLVAALHPAYPNQLHLQADLGNAHCSIDTSNTPRLPFNLLQQNPVLLV